MRSSSDRSPRVGTCPNRTVTDSFHRPAFHFTGSIAALDSRPLEQSLTSRSTANHCITETSVRSSRSTEGTGVYSSR